MKNLYLITSIILTELIILVVLEKKEYQFFPNLPAGQFHVFFKTFLQCHTRDNELKPNLFLYKISHNTTEIRGNLTLNTLFDDTLSYNVNSAIKDSIGGWKDNALLFSKPKACSTFIKFMGAEWTTFRNNFRITDTKCPISPGVYISKGYDFSGALSNMNFPKIFFYGTYKTRLFFTNKNNKEHGCVIFIYEIKRPWENE